MEQVGLFYQARRDCFREQLLTTKLVPLPVSGGYFQLVDYGAVSDLSDVEFSRWLAVEKGWCRFRYRRSMRLLQRGSVWCGCVSLKMI